MAAMGVNVQVLPGGEIYLALERGAIDAAEFTGPYDDEKLGLPKAALLLLPGLVGTRANAYRTGNQQAWAKLPKAYQEMFRSACQSANLLMLSRYDGSMPWRSNGCRATPRWSSTATPSSRGPKRYSRSVGR